MAAPHSSWRRLALLTALVVAPVLLLTACSVMLPPTPGAPTTAGSLPNGVAAGDVTGTSAVLWARSTVTGPVTFQVTSDGMSWEQTAPAPDASLPVTVTVDNLTPGTQYRYRVTTANGDNAGGVFRTPHAADGHYGLRFGASGDWRGSLLPFVAARNVPARDLDFFVAMGDSVYADRPSPAVPLVQAATPDEFRRKHAEVYSEAAGMNTLADLRASTALFATIDDHEVTNDFAGGAPAAADGRFAESSGLINQTALYTNGLETFFAFNPLRAERYGGMGGDGRMDGAPKLYRYRVFGLDAALFILDARSFRDLPLARPDRNDPADVARFRAETFRPERTMLGHAQMADLQRDLLDAQARGVTWKFIAIPEPIQHRGLMSAQDRFEGYAAERAALLRFIDEEGISNVVFVSADIHGTQVNNITYSLGPDAPQIALPVFEVTTGPLAYSSTLGPIIIADGRDKGYVTEEEAAAYAALPVANDPDNVPDDRDDFAKAIVDRELVAAGYDPLGLDGAPVDAALLAGDYVALHSYGWTEFDIDAATQVLTVTTYGVAPYVESDLETAPQDVWTREPAVVSQFRVTPQ